MRFFVLVTCLIITSCVNNDLPDSSAVILGTVSCLHQPVPKGYALVNHERTPIAVFYGHTAGADDLKDCQAVVNTNNTYQCVEIKFVSWNTCEYLKKEW